MVTLAQLKQIVPHAGKRADEFIDPLNGAMEEFEINLPLRECAFIAQLAHESGSFIYMEEIASGAAYDHREDLGNTKPDAILIAQANGTTPGRWFKGHGPIQITGYDNHKFCGEYLGLDLLRFPRLICLPKEGCRAAGWYWHIYKDLNPLADAEDFKTITRRINGGLNGYEDRCAFYERAKKVLL